MKILIIDDSTVARLNAQRTAAKFGNVDMAVNGREGLDVAVKAWEDQQAYDVILLDLDMPELDGEGFLSELRSYEEANDCAQPSYVIVISASLNKSKLIRLMQFDCSDYIIKPYRDTELLEKLFEIKKLTHH